MNNVITVDFIPQREISQAYLEILTRRVLQEVFKNNLGDMMWSYHKYCIERGLPANRRVHYDWANDMLQTVTCRTGIQLL